MWVNPEPAVLSLSLLVLGRERMETHRGRDTNRASERANKAVRVNVWFTWKCSGSWTANLPLHLPSQLRGLGITTTGFRIYVFFIFFTYLFCTKSTQLPDSSSLSAFIYWAWKDVKFAWSWDIFTNSRLWCVHLNSEHSSFNLDVPRENYFEFNLVAQNTQQMFLQTTHMLAVID